MKRIKAVLARMQRKADFWAGDRKIDSKKKYYKTGQIAHILGLKDARAVMRLIQRNLLRAKQIDGGGARSSYWVVSQRALSEYVRKNRESIEERMNQEMEEFYEFLCASEVLSGFSGLRQSMKLVVSNLNPLTSMTGATADIKRMDAFQRMIRIMARHIKLRFIFAKAKER